MTNIVEFRGFTLTDDDIANMETKGVNYLLAYGFKKSLQDCVSGMQKKLEDEGELTKEEIEDKLLETMQARYDDILASEVGTRTVGPRLKGLDKFMAEIAERDLKAAFSKTGNKWPEGKGSAEKIAKYREAYIAKHGDKVRAEAQAAMEAANSAADTAEDLLADLGI